MNESRWENLQEWKRDQDELEVKIERILPAGYQCVAKGCDMAAVKEFEIGLVAEMGSGVPIDVCADHDDVDLAFDIYKRIGSQL